MSAITPFLISIDKALKMGKWPMKTPLPWSLS